MSKQVGIPISQRINHIPSNSDGNLPAEPIAPNRKHIPVFQRIFEYDAIRKSYIAQFEDRKEVHGVCSSLITALKRYNLLGEICFRQSGNFILLQAKDGSCLTHIEAAEHWQDAVNHELQQRGAGGDPVVVLVGMPPDVKTTIKSEQTNHIPSNSDKKLPAEPIVPNRQYIFVWERIFEYNAVSEFYVLRLENDKEAKAVRGVLIEALKRYDLQGQVHFSRQKNTVLLQAEEGANLTHIRAAELWQEAVNHELEQKGGGSVSVLMGGPDTEVMIDNNVTVTEARNNEVERISVGKKRSQPDTISTDMLPPAKLSKLMEFQPVEAGYTIHPEQETGVTLPPPIDTDLSLWPSLSDNHDEIYSLFNQYDEGSVLDNSFPVFPEPDNSSWVSRLGYDSSYVEEELSFEERFGGKAPRSFSRLF